MTRRGRARFGAYYAAARAELAAHAARGANLREVLAAHCPDGATAADLDAQARDLRALAHRAGWRPTLDGASPDD